MWEKADLPVHTSRRWKKRSILEIEHLVFHHTAAVSKLTNIARYHVTPSPSNHMSQRGAPGLCYHFAIEPDGRVLQCNGLDDIVWSNGRVKVSKKKSNATGLKLGKNMNTYSIGVLVMGDFAGPGHKGGDPSREQIASCMEIARWAHSELGIKLNNILGHCHINKKMCPGFAITELIEDYIWKGEGMAPVVVPSMPPGFIEMVMSQMMARPQITVLGQFLSGGNYGKGLLNTPPDRQ